LAKPAPAVANFLEIEHFGTSMLERLSERDRKQAMGRKQLV
jgi:hypothetical protein